MNSNLNIISPKSLEKQLKLVEGRMGALEAEIADLQKIKEACLVLLGSAPQTEPVEIEASAPAPKSKKKTPKSEEQETASSSDSPDDESEENAAVN